MREKRGHERQMRIGRLRHRISFLYIYAPVALHATVFDFVGNHDNNFRLGEEKKNKRKRESDERV